MRSVSEKAGKNLGDVQSMNRTLVLRTLREHEICSRSDLAKITGLQQTTITNIIGDLMRFGIVEETGLLKGSRGRRSIGLTLNVRHYRILALRLTRSEVLSGLYDISGACHLLDRAQIRIEDGVSKALETIQALIRRMLNRTNPRGVLGICLGLPGPFLREGGKIALMADFPGWENVSLREELEPVFGIPVYQEFDAYACALAEWWFGGQRGDAHVLLSISMEQGLGAGVISDGQLFYGSQGVAGNIGHLSIDHQGKRCECGNYGCLRMYSTARALVRNVRAAMAAGESTQLGPDSSLPAIIKATHAGDSLAVREIQRVARYLGYGLVSLVYAYNPEVIILSREFAAAGELYLAAVRQVLQERLMPSLCENVRVVFTRLESDPVLMGTVALGIDWAFKQPTRFLELQEGPKPSEPV